MIVRRFVLLLLVVFVSSVVFAQLPSLPSNLSNIRSSDVTDEQITQITTYMKQNNVSSQQAYDLLIRRGMNSAEASNIKERIDKAGENSTTSKDTRNTTKAQAIGEDETRISDTTNKTKVIANPRKIFGLEIFNNGVLTFEPNLKIATPTGYIIGPDDEMVINIYGYQEARYSLKVAPEGDITIPYAGVVYVAGLTIEQAAEKIKSRLAGAGYSNIKTGLTKVAVSIGRIRSIKVTVLGSVNKPGTYTLPSLATAFNALYLSGGPTETGSMRNIVIVRNGKTIDSLDIYDFLVKGDQRGNINLRDQDVVRVPDYKVRVSIEGQVKRPGLYEIKPKETLQDLLEFAGGFADSAYTAAITGYKITDIENKIADIDQSQYSSYHPSRSESFTVKKVIGRFVNKISINGAVYLPGDYELTPGLTLKDAIQKARGLKEDAYNARGLILRTKEDLQPEYVSFSPLDVVRSGVGNISLQPNDKITISSVSELKENATVVVNGEVRFPGVYSYIENMSLKDLILLAGGFSDAAIPQRIEVARRLRKDTFNVKNLQISDVYDITSVKDLDVRGGDIKLQPYDAVVIRKNPGYQTQINVRVEGEVIFPGPYVLKTKNERISDVIKRAGGLTPQAYEQGGYLTRVNRTAMQNQLNTQKISKIQETLKDTTNKVEEEVARTVDQIAIDLKDILSKPGSRNDLVLEEGDVITILKEKMDVRISGQVLFPTRVVFDQKLDMEEYIGRAGGVADNARRSKIYVLYPNGNAAQTKHFLFFRSYPLVTPGSEVIVPKRHLVERRRLSTGEVIGIATAITSFAGVLLSLLINVKK